MLPFCITCKLPMELQRQPPHLMRHARKPRLSNRGHLHHLPLHQLQRTTTTTPRRHQMEVWARASWLQEEPASESVASVLLKDALTALSKEDSVFRMGPSANNASIQDVPRMSRRLVCAVLMVQHASAVNKTVAARWQCKGADALPMEPKRSSVALMDVPSKPFWEECARSITITTRLLRREFNHLLSIRWLNASRLIRHLKTEMPIPSSLPIAQRASGATLEDFRFSKR